MSLYALGDLHLFSEDENFMDKYGRVWVRHKEKILKNCSKIVKDEDTIVFTGDNSFAKKINRCFDDMDFIKSLPILLRENLISCRIIFIRMKIMPLLEQRDLHLRDRFT